MAVVWPAAAIVGWRLSTRMRTPCIAGNATSTPVSWPAVLFLMQMKTLACAALVRCWLRIWMFASSYRPPWRCRYVFHTRSRNLAAPAAPAAPPGACTAAEATGAVAAGAAVLLSPRRSSPPPAAPLPLTATFGDMVSAKVMFSSSLFSMVSSLRRRSRALSSFSAYRGISRRISSLATPPVPLRMRRYSMARCCTSMAQCFSRCTNSLSTSAATSPPYRFDILAKVVMRSAPV
mmetsp:Transcript_13033/g.48364  ORF Transcript_13033/g.48364 Transcript_13033/m.48364 type:complete len:234 (-) Transcript_13033:1810-2511(-)